MKGLLISASPLIILMLVIIVIALLGGMGKPGSTWHIPSWWDPKYAKKTQREWTAADRNEWWEQELAPYKDHGPSAELAVRKAVFENRTAPWMEKG
jgi:hypothetical protein